MINRISSLAPLPDYLLAVTFDDGKRVIYDLSSDFNLPGYSVLRDVPGLYRNAQLDQSRTCVYWNVDVDLPSDIIYEYGKTVS